MSISCDFDFCAAWFLSTPVTPSAVVASSNRPPSRLRLSCIFVSFVSRLMMALRTRSSIDVAAVCFSENLWIVKLGTCVDELIN